MALFENSRLQLHARLAGFLFLFYIAAIAFGSFLVSSSAVAGDSQGIAGQADLANRSGLLIQLLGGMSAIPLGFSLYVLLRPIDGDWALAAFMWRVGEGVLNGASSVFRFSGADLMAARATMNGADTEVATQLLRTASAATFPIAVIFFSIGSIIFFWLLLKSRFIPRWLSWAGVVGSVLATVLGLLSLLLVDPPAWLPALWAPLAIAEIVGGLLLLIKGADLRHLPSTPPAART